MALRYGRLAESRLVARPFDTTSPLLTVSPDYLRRHPAPTTPQDLVQHNCLIFNRGGRRHGVWRFARNGQWTEVRVRTATAAWTTPRWRANRPWRATASR